MLTTIRHNFWKPIYDKYGSKKGFLRFWYYQCLLKVGAFRKYSYQDYRNPGDTPRRLVFVCVGNICRSPLAEAYAKSFGVDAASFGLNCTDGHPADPRTVQYGIAFGLDLSDHKTINLKNFSIRDGDILVGMEPKHVKELGALPLKGVPVVLAGVACRKPIAYIHDPYNCSESYFDRCEATVLEAVRGILG